MSVALKDVTRAIIDCPHSTAPTKERGIPQIRTTDIQNGRLNFQTARRVSEATYKAWITRGEPEPGDLILAREAPVGEVGLIPPGARACLGQRTVLIKPDTERVVPRYLLYLLLTPRMKQEMLSRAEGSTTPHLNVAEVRNLVLPEFPSLDHQERVAGVLGALDDKIELNRRMNETLEATPRAIFKSWFVDFDPVHQPAIFKTFLAPEVAALFPDRFAQSPNGLIPTGWQVGAFIETAEVVSGGTPKTSVPAYWEGSVPWFSVVDAPAETDVFVIDTARKITGAGLENSAADVMPAGTTIITARGTVGKVALTGVPMAMNQSCYGIIGKNGYGSWFTYYRVRHLVDLLRQRTHGSVFDTITRETFRSVEVANPPLPLAKEFDATVEPFLARIRANLFESKTLANTRDALLPRLVLGDVRMDGNEA